MVRRMRIHTADFILGARGLGDCPAWAHPEVALIGRSNVGKSSLINLLVNRKELAKVSSTPGKTRQLNFFLINGKWGLVDLPGYGFAKGPKTERFDFNALVGDYLERRENLRHVFVLIDSRLPPQRIDLDFCAWLGGTGRDFSLVFTKTDKQSAAKTGAGIALFQEAVHPLLGMLPETLTSSATHRIGRDQVLRAIASAISDKNQNHHP
jgi:GTP-binding protein